MNYFSKLNETILPVMFFILLFSCVFCFYNAYENLFITNSRIAESNALFYEKLAETISEKKDLKKIEQYIDSIMYKGKGVLDANAISFLFQIFTISLVTTGVYLLSKTHNNLKESEKKIKLITPFLTNITKINELASQINYTVQLSNSITPKSVELKIDNGFILLRDAIKEMRNKFENAILQRTGIEEYLNASFLNHIQIVLTKLKLFKTKPKSIIDINERIDDCEYIMKLLEEKVFIGIYEKEFEIFIENKISK